MAFETDARYRNMVRDFIPGGLDAVGTLNLPRLRYTDGIEVVPDLFQVQFIVESGFVYLIVDVHVKIAGFVRVPLFVIGLELTLVVPILHLVVDGLPSGVGEFLPNEFALSA